MINTFIYSESPMNPLTIERQEYRAGLALEKHNWTFPILDDSYPDSLYVYYKVDKELPANVFKEKYTYFSKYDYPEEAKPLMDNIAPKATPQPPLHFTLVYETPLSIRSNDLNREVERSLVGRLLEQCQTPVYLAFHRTIIEPLGSMPERTVRQVETILGSPWSGVKKLRPKFEIVPLPDVVTRHRALLSLGIKDYTRFYLLATSVEPNSLSSDALKVLDQITFVKDDIYYPHFHSLVSQCDWILTNHNLFSGHVPFCFYSPQDIREKLLNLHQKTASQDKRQLVEVKEIAELPNPDPTKTIDIYPQIYPETEISVSDILSQEALREPEEIFLGWSNVTNIDELLSKRSIKSLNLDGTPFRHWNTLAQMNWLESLSIRQIQFIDINFITSLTSLKHLSITRLPWKKGLKPLGELPHLESLCLDWMNVKDLSSLTRCNSLKKLSLKHTTVENISPLGEISSLQHLDLEKTSVTDLNPLTKLPSLKSLSIGDNPIQDISCLPEIAGLRELKIESQCCIYILVTDWSPISAMEDLEILSIYSNPLSDISFLAGLKTLRSLRLSQTPVKNFSPLQNLSQLEELDLWDTSVNDLQPLTGLKNLRKLYMSSWEVRDFSPLSQMVSLEELNLLCGTIENISWLPNLKNLKELSLALTFIENFDISVLTALERLEKLSLQGKNIENIENYSPLAALSHLKHLDLSGSYNFKSSLKDLSWLENLTGIEELFLNDTEVDNIDVLAGMKQLRTLNLANTKVKSLEPLSHATNLKKLILDDTPVEDLSPLQNCRQLEQLSIQATKVWDLSVLTNFVNLKELDCRYSPIEDEDATSLLDLHRLWKLKYSPNQHDFYLKLRRRHRVVLPSDTVG